MKLLIAYYLVFLLHALSPPNLRAYAVACGGKNQILDPDNAKFIRCDLSIQYSGGFCVVGDKRFLIYRRQNLWDSVVVLFGTRRTTHGPDDVSIAFIPKHDGSWMVGITWQDSTKAYKAKAL